MDAAAPPTLLLTCEHADRRVPRPWRHLFAGAGKALASHEGWDPGALRLARALARRLGAPLLATGWTRLLVDANRSPHNPRIWSRFTRDLPREERRDVLARYWRPHRERVEAAVEGAVARGGRVVHVAVHSFTPVWHGEARGVDVGLLYDSRRRAEAFLARRWREALRARMPELRVRLNQPYLGRADGLTTWLRRRHAQARYRGLELEVSQALADGPEARRLADALAASLAEALAGAASRGRVAGR